MTIRQEFEKAFMKQYPLGNKPPLKNHSFKAAMFGALWAFSEAEKRFDTEHKSKGKLAAIVIRQLARELDEEGKGVDDEAK